MARTRSIKPEFWSDEKMSKVSLQARLLYIGIWSTCDDAGTTKGHPVWLKSQIFPYDDINIKQFQVWVDELIALKRAIPYDVHGEMYLYIPGFPRHQKIQHPSPAKNPPPPESLISFHESLMNESRMTHEQTETETETETEAKGIHENVLPVDNLQSQPEDHLPPFYQNLKSVIGEIQEAYPSPHDQRMAMKFIECNHRNKNPDAVIHCLKSLLKAKANNTEIGNIEAYLKAAMRMENQNYNARDHDRRTEDLKGPPTRQGMQAMKSIMAGMGA